MTNDLLEIPAFLKRDKEVAPRRGGPRQRKTKGKSAHPFGKRPPKALAGATRVWVHLGDECPRIGCGFHRVWAKSGRIWCRLCDATGNRGRLSLRNFEQAASSAAWVGGGSNGS